MLDVLTGHEGQQLGGPDCAGGERLSVQDGEGGRSVAHERIDQGRARRIVVPVTRRLAHSGVLVVAQKGGAHRSGEGAGRQIEGGEQLADGGAQLGDGVLGGHGVIEGVESSTRARVLSAPVSIATTLVSSKRRRGRAEARSRLR